MISQFFTNLSFILRTSGFVDFVYIGTTEELDTVFCQFKLANKEYNVGTMDRTKPTLWFKIPAHLLEDYYEIYANILENNGAYYLNISSAHYSILIHQTDKHFSEDYIETIINTPHCKLEEFKGFVERPLKGALVMFNNFEKGIATNGAVVIRDEHFYMIGS